MDFDLKLMLFAIQIMLLGGFEMLASSAESGQIPELILIIGFLVGVAGLIRKNRSEHAESPKNV